MNIALVGFGVENQSAFRYWQQKGASITICDQNSSIDIPAGTASQLGAHYLDNLDRFDLIVRTVGMRPDEILEKNPVVAHKIITAVTSFFEDCKTPIIGVTGTKGKGTTATLIHQLLIAGGKTALLAGNIGVPMLDILEESKQADYVVLELSSFQLLDLQASPARAVCLMVVPEHLNWHTSMEEYLHAKGNLFRYQLANNVAVYDALNSNSTTIASASPAQTKYTYAVAGHDEPTSLYTCYVQGDAIYYHQEEIVKTTDVKLRGRHNLENVCAAIAATYDLIDGNKEAIRSVVSSFSGLEHRLEEVAIVKDVLYVDDSFATTPETAIAALRSFEQPVIGIVGGSDKGVPFDALADEIVTRRLKHVLTIGDTGPHIAELLRQRGYQAITDSGLDNMTAIINVAASIAQPGDVVLLSTGCASFGMFKDYKDRGNQFRQAVQALVATGQ